MSYYVDTKTGRRVSRSTWARSKAHGGSRYVRKRSGGTKPPPGGRKPPGRPPRGAGGGSGGGSQGPESTPKTWEEYKRYVEEVLSKRKRKEIYDEGEPFDGPEFDTGVDY
jgi:hypothetical protein